MNTSDKAHSILKKYFGYDTFRSHQLDIIKSIVDNKDVLVLMPTGGGKSLCFQIPAILMEGTCLVVSPLISLMKDQVDALQSAGVAAGYMNSSQSAAEAGQVWQQYCRGELKLLYLSPEKMIAGFEHLMKAAPVSMIAVDEAHCISSWGHDFREEYTQLSVIKRNFPTIPVVALTATADRLTRDDILKQLLIDDAKRYVSSFDRPNLSISVRAGLSKKHKDQEIIDFVSQRSKECGIIYCLSRKATEEVATLLYTNGIRAASYHAGMSAQDRNDIQSAFINDDIKIICATIAFGMGIDKSNVRWVIHYNMPKNIEGYYQEIGRAGRDGLPSDTVLYFNYNDAIVLSNFAQESGKPELNVSKLRRMQQFAEATTCRRKILLTYFGEQRHEDCGNCDVCKNPPQMFDGTVIAQKALSAAYRTGESVGTQMIIKILRASVDKQLMQRGYHKLKTYGVGKEISAEHWQQFIMQLMNLGLFEIAYDRGFALRITDTGKDILFGKRKIELAQAVDKVKIEKKKKALTVEEDLFEKLRDLRMKFAKQENVPPYVIFNDATLREMSAEKPVTETDMLAISGVGEAKLAHYGRDFIYCIKNYMLTANRKVKGATYIETLEFINKGLSLEQIAEKRNLAPTTIYSHIAQLYAKGEEINIYNYVNEYEIQQVKEAVRETKQTEAMKPIFDFLNEEIDYGKIRLALAHLEKLEMK